MMVWSVVLIAVIGAGVYLLQPDPVPVDMSVVSRGPLAVTAREDGLTRIRERYAISTPLTGRLMRITLDVGDPVSADQTVIARMEPTLPSLLDPRTLAQAQARVRAAERRLQVANVQLEAARAQADHAETERVRIYQSHQRGAASDAELQQAKLEARLRSDGRRAAEYSVEIAQYELELEKSALLLARGEGSGDTHGDRDDAGDAAEGNDSTEAELVIRAPIDGRVLRVHQENSAVIPAGTVLLEVGDPSDLELVVDVLSRDAVRIEPGAGVVVRRWGGDDPLHGSVRYIEPSGFTKFSALGVEEQRVNVVIDLVESPEQRQTLGDAFRVEAEITLWQTDAALLIPTSALFRQGQGWATFIVADGQARQREVEIGQMNPSLAEVLRGVDEGEWVIEYPGDRIHDGVRVAER
jgi:HlyD family secretion protein